MLIKVISRTIAFVLLLTISSCTNTEIIAADTTNPKTTPLETVTDETAVEKTVPSETAAGPESKEEPTGDTSEVLVSLGDKKLTTQQVEWIMQNPDKKRMASFAKWWVENELLNEEAERQGLTKQPKLAFLAELEKTKTISKQLIAKATEVTDEDALDYYEKNKGTDSKLRQLDCMSFSHISTKTLQQCNEALERIKAGWNINELAKELSKHRDAGKGGKAVKYPYSVIKKQFGQKFFKALMVVEPGTTIGPLEVKGGYEIILLEEKIKERAKPFEEVKARLKSTLSGQKRRKGINDLLDQLREKAADRIIKSPALIKMEEGQTDKQESQN